MGSFISDRPHRVIPQEAQDRWTAQLATMEAEAALEARDEQPLVIAKQEHKIPQDVKHNKRELVPFERGDNDTDVVINGAHYNLTTLRAFEFATYSNGTMSNSSYCYLTLPMAVGNMPQILPNGTIINGTTCYLPLNPLGIRGNIGIAFAALFGVSVVFILVSLRKHGKLFLPQTKRFRAIGRRWTWYWALFVAACGMIACFSAVDVDRYYIPSAPIIIQTLFWYLAIPAILACVWENVRHWGSWQERQLYDAEPFLYKNHDVRSQVEFYLPLIFYLFAWLNFFLNIPRNWLGFQLQSSPDQITDSFIPTTLDVRFKAGAILGFVAWCIIPIHLCHTLYWYKRAARSRTCGVFRAIPLHIYFTLPLALVVVAYAEAAAWVSSINIGGLSVNPGYVYGLGWAPALLIIIIHVASALRNPNEDLELMRQRVVRGQEFDRAFGVDRKSRKPRWWSNVANEMGMDNDAKLRALINSNVGHRRRDEDVERDVQMHNLARQHLDDEISPAAVSSNRPPENSRRDHIPPREGLLNVTTPRPPLHNHSGQENSYAQSFDSETTAVSRSQPQQIRSMLDV